MIAIWISLASLIAPPDPGRDLSLAHLEITQGLQRDANDIPLVAGKPTVIRAFPRVEDGGAPVDGVSARLHAVRDGTELPGSPIEPDNGPITARGSVRRIDPDASLNFTLDPDWYEEDTDFWAELAPPDGFEDDDSSNDRIPSCGEMLQARYQESGSLRISYLRIRYTNEDWTGDRTPDARVEAQEACDWLRSIFPMDPTRITYTPWSPAEIVFDRGSSTGNLNGARLVTELNTLLATSPELADRLYAWTPANSYSSNGLSDPVWGGGQGVVAFGNDTTGKHRRTFAHEIGHNTDDQGLRHTIDRLEDDEFGFDVLGVDPDQRVVMRRYPQGDADGPLNLFDFMRGGEIEVHAWIVPRHYERLLAVYAPSEDDPARLADGGGDGDRRVADAADIAEGNGGEEARDEDAPPLAEGGPPVLLEVRGEVTRDGEGQFYSFYEVPASDGPPHWARDLPNDGTHSIRFLDQDGEELKKIAWTPVFRADDQAEDEISVRPFTWYLDPLDGVRRVILSKGEVQLDVMEVSERGPEIDAVRTRENRTADGQETLALEWDVSLADSRDVADRSEVLSQVYYSADDGRSWRLVATGLSDMDAEVDLSTLPGGRARLMVKTTDGYNVATRITDPFDVENRPPSVEIIAPRSNRGYLEGAGVTLVGQASDLEGDELPEEAFRWESDLQGEIGVRRKLVARDLVPGTHQIVLRVKDSTGAEGVSRPLELTIRPRPGR
ncbi:hypothetical protein AB1L88_01990 [Tautonia sp. JC769]|uniref:hypothetical protein n=1 Tax=Tautonia sp. JC769 TaxID=3232135 RepID=UPI003457758B